MTSRSSGGLRGAGNEFEVHCQTDHELSTVVEVAEALLVLVSKVPGQELPVSPLFDDQMVRDTGFEPVTSCV